MLKNYYLKEDLPIEKAYFNGVRSLTDSELLSIIIDKRYKEKDSLDLARDVIELSAKEEGFTNLTVEELSSINGITRKNAITILASIELGKRQTYLKKQKLIINSPQDIFNYLKTVHYSHLESVIFFYFSQSGKFLHEYVVSSGGISMVQLNLNEVVKNAIKHSANYVVMAHNHPSSNEEPSEEDDLTTKEIMMRLNAFDIVLVDHIIFTEYSYYSYRANDKF